MKKRLIIISATLALIVSNQIHSQAAIFALLFGDKVASENFNISLELGGSLPMYSNLDNSKRSKIGINFGMAGNLKLSENWFLSPNIYFLARRNLRLNEFSLNTGNTELDSQFMDVPTEVILNYIDVPILFFYQTNNKKYRFGLGPQVSFLQKSRGQFSGIEGNFTQNFDGYTRDIDYGIMADIAYVLGKAHKGKGVHVHFRYYYGFTDILNNALSTNFNRSSYFSLHLSLPFITEELAEKNLKELEDTN